MTQKGKPAFERPRVLFEWNAPTRRFKKKNSAWFAALVLIALTLFILLWLFVHWSTAFLVLSLAFVLFVWYFFEPGQANYQVLSIGIKINAERFLFENLRFFWVETKDGVKTLHFATYINYPPLLSLVLPKSIDQEKLEEELLKYLPYHEQQQRDWVQSLEGVFEGLAAYLPPWLVGIYEKAFHKSASFVSARFARSQPN